MSFTVKDGERRISPLHLAPWVGTNEIFPAGIAPHLVKLGGDFFCAPFGQELDGAPLHGWTANSNWSVESKSEHAICARLDKLVKGASIVKEIELLPEHPLVYQRHTISGGSGEIQVANHANVALPDGGLIRTSRKQFWATPSDPLESDPACGRSGLQYPAKSKTLDNFPALEGTADLTQYPWFPEHEDFVLGLEDAGNQFGWTAVTRPAQGDLFLSLRNTASLPVTMLWHSNGGRDYPPWSGRHFGCLGVEEGVVSSMLPAAEQEAQTAPGSLPLADGQSFSVCHVIGAIDWPCKEAVQSIEQAQDHIVVTSTGGFQREIPFLAGFIGLNRNF
ncbi:MAG: hypothetical protein ACR2O0_03340 [Rhizobiaceae bacterium]